MNEPVKFSVVCVVTFASLVFGQACDVIQMDVILLLHVYDKTKNIKHDKSGSCTCSKHQGFICMK